MNIVYLATINDFDGTSIVGIYSGEANALRGAMEYLREEDERSEPVNMKRYDGYVAYGITHNTAHLVIREMEIDDFGIKNGA